MSRFLIAAVALLAASPAPSPKRRAPAPSTDLREFMTRDLNPAFTDVSYLLYHAPKGAAGWQDRVVASTEKLRDLVDQLSSHAEAGTDEELTSFKVHSVQLRIAARALAAAEPGEREGWFRQVSAVCNSCHDENKH